MVDIQRIGIRRKVYRFEARKRYAPTRSFRIRRREPIDDIRAALRALLAPRPSGAKAAALRYGVPVASAPRSGLNVPLVAGAILLAMLLIGGVWLYLSTSSPFLPATPPSMPTLQPAFENDLLATGAITAGDRTSGQYVAYVRSRAASRGIANYSLTLTPYAAPLPSSVFLLQSHRQQAEGYHEFITALRQEFRNHGKTVAEVDMADLERLPSGAIVIVPSGNIPRELLGIGSRTSVVKLANGGVVLLYIGLPFNNMQDNDLVVATPPPVLTSLGITFQDGAPPPVDFGLFQPLYQASGGAGLSSERIYGSVSVLSSPSGGAIVFLPQTLDGGWPGNMRAAAGNVTRLLTRMSWRVPLASARTYAVPVEGPLQLLQSFSTPMKSTSGFLRLEWSASDREGRLRAREWRVVPFTKDARGDLYVQGGYAITPTYITNQPVRMNIRFNETGSASRALFLSIINSTSEVGERAGRGQVNVIGEVPFDVPIQTDTGEYIGRIVDEENRVYAQTYLQVASVDIRYAGQRGRGIYAFEIYKGDHKENLDVEVSVDEGQYGTYRFTNTADIAVNVLSRTGGEDLPSVRHTFTFQLGALRKSVVVDPPPRAKSFVEDPLFLATVVTALAIVGLGIYLGRRDDVVFQLDIPDFPPVARTKIPLRPESILGLFARINSDYRWEFVPLTVSEIKTGFKGMLHQGKPILISDYNVEFLMEQLKARGLAGTFLEYYAPTAWEKQSGSPVRHLCLFRRLRDVFVNNAVPFTSRGKEPDCDTRITIVGQEMYVHLFDGFGADQVAAMVGRILRTVHRGISILVFADEEEKKKFEDLLSSSGQGVRLLGMEASSGSVMLLTHTEFEKTVKEFKVF